MEPIKVSSAQFEHQSGDKDYNLSVIEALPKKQLLKAVIAGIAFHECSITGYTFARDLSKNANAGPRRIYSRRRQHPKTYRDRKTDIIFTSSQAFLKKIKTIIYSSPMSAWINTGLVAKFRKLHPFINPHVMPGDEYCVFESARMEMRDPDLLR